MIVLRILGIVCLLVALSIWLVICIAAGVSSGIKTYFDNKLESARKQNARGADERRLTDFLGE
jgi:hypothetical protein